MENQYQWIDGDGGPTIVLQGSAVAQWQGADDFENSLMNGGEVETDYDVICQCDAPEGPPYVIHHYGRDMLVLDDSEWSARLSVLDSGAVAILQIYVYDEELPGILERVAQTQPSGTLVIRIEDSTLRLQVGADNGTKYVYSYQEVPITPGNKIAHVYRFDDGLVTILKAC